MSISKSYWLFIGQSFFGLLIGGLVGLSISPIVGTVMGLLFAFIGGSLIVLIKGRDEGELEMIGKSITALSFFMLVGVSLGISLRTNSLFTSPPAYTLSAQLSIDDIKALGPKIEYADLLCALILGNNNDGGKVGLNPEQLKELIELDVAPKVLQAMLGYDRDCPAIAEKQVGPTLLGGTNSGPDKDDQVRY